MKYFKARPRQGVKPLGAQTFSDDDPLSGLANLFDLGLVFIVGLIATLFTAYHLQELFDTKSNLTIVKQDSKGQMEIISKKGKKIKAIRVTKTQAQGQGTRLGVAYRLKDGSLVYVPDQGQ